jgi:hypothetical protein
MKKTSRLVLTIGSAAAAVAVIAACGAADPSHSTAVRAPATITDPTIGTTFDSSAQAGSGAADSGAVTSGAAPVPEPATAGSAPGSAASGGSGETKSGTGVPTATDATDLQQAVIRTGSIQMTTKNPTAARARILGLVTGLGGIVANEDSSSDNHGNLDQINLTLRIPSTQFGQALEQIRKYGTVTDVQQSAQDVTTQVIDVNARVKTQQASVDSIRQLLARATTIGQVMSIEDVLASRQATLDSLEQQQKYLADQTSLSTLQVTLTEPAAHPVPPVKHHGFVGGLERGWHALGRSAVAVGAAIGAVLPFAGLIALVGAPLFLVRRGRRRTAVAEG